VYVSYSKRIIFPGADQILSSTLNVRSSTTLRVLTVVFLPLEKFHSRLIGRQKTNVKATTRPLKNLST
jgi:hypothetical protein